MKKQYDLIISPGNSLHVNELADYASMEGEKAGRFAVEYVTAERMAQSS